MRRSGLSSANRLRPTALDVGERGPDVRVRELVGEPRHGRVFGFAAVLHDSEKVTIRMMPGVPGRVVGRGGIAAVCKGALPVRLTFEMRAMTAAAFDLIDHGTPRDLRFVLRIGRGITGRSKYNENGPGHSDNDDCAHSEYSTKGVTPPGRAAASSNSIRSLLLLAHAPSRHEVASPTLADDVHETCQRVYGVGRAMVTFPWGVTIDDAASYPRHGSAVCRIPGRCTRESQHANETGDEPVDSRKCRGGALP